VKSTASQGTTTKKVELLWMNDYLMVMYEVEKARRVRQVYRKEEPSPTGSPPSAAGKCKRKRTLRR
jgi:hypothetical protein